MFASRSEKILSLVSPSLKTPAPILNENAIDKEEDNGNLNKTNAMYDQYKDLISLQPLQPVLDPQSSLAEALTQPFLIASSVSESSNVMDISASTSNLIDKCLSEDIILSFEQIELTNLTSPEPAVDECPVRESLEEEPIKKGFMCYHCSIVFENKKVLRQHISKRHMAIDVDSCIYSCIMNKAMDVENKIKKKNANDNRATTKKKREERKFLRVAGKAYTSVKGTQVKSRERKEFSCSSRCTFKCSDKFTKEEKDDFFLEFWKIGEVDRSQDRQRQYVVSLIAEVEPESARVNGISRKKRSLHYFLEKSSERVRVCRLFFLSVFGVTEKFVRVCLDKRSDTGVIAADTRGKRCSINKIPIWIEEHARMHIQSIPKVESHYCRKSTNKLYLSSQLNLEKLYNLYLEKCQEDNLNITKDNEKADQDHKKPLIRPVSKSEYKLYFYSYGNLRFHKPKKDQCSTCNRFCSLSPEQQKVEEEEYNKHMKNKETVREVKRAKVNEYGNSNNQKTVINFDLEAILECPKGEVSSIFYKRKLAVYNLTVFDLISKEGTCHIWDETEGKRGSIEIGTCIFNYIKNHSKTDEFFLMSDSCGGQNLNQYLSTALLHAVKLTHCKVIDHVYYEPGHSQQEGDSIHASIERAAKNVQVNVPSEWGIICQMARKIQNPIKLWI